MGFDIKWENKDGSQFDKIMSTIKPSDPLKSKLVATIRRIDNENQRLNQTSLRFLDRDKMIFNKIVEAYTIHDTASATVYANELKEVRKMEKMILHVKLALEQISLRMKTITELGDVAVTLIPIVEIINEVKTGIVTINPQVEKELGDICNLLNNIVVDASTPNNAILEFESMNEDSSKILDEAQIIANSNLGKTFPKLPVKGKSQQVDDGFGVRS